MIVSGFNADGMDEAFRALVLSCSRDHDRLCRAWSEMQGGMPPRLADGTDGFCRAGEEGGTHD